MYDKYVQKLKDICDKKQFFLDTFGQTGKYDEYTLYSITINKKSKNKKNVLFTAGVHGDESSGPLSILEFLKKIKIVPGAPKIIILPVLNPSGFDKNQHRNYKNINLNRHFCHKKLRNENKLIYNKIKKKKIYFASSFHEDDVKKGTYIHGHNYGKNPDFSYFYDILKTAKRYHNICLDEKIHGNSASEGFISAISYDGSLENRLNVAKVPYVSCVEVPSKISLKKRIRINTAIMKKIISFCSK